MITADEVQFAGASGSTTNKTYYLYNGYNYWVMTPYIWQKAGYAVVFLINTSGNLLAIEGVYGTNNSARPVINLKPDVTFNLGSDGTENNPYIVQ